MGPSLHAMGVGSSREEEEEEEEPSSFSPFLLHQKMPSRRRRRRQRRRRGEGTRKEIHQSLHLARDKYLSRYMYSWKWSLNLTFGGLSCITKVSYKLRRIWRPFPLHPVPSLLLLPSSSASSITIIPSGGRIMWEVHSREKKGKKELDIPGWTPDPTFDREKAFPCSQCLILEAWYLLFG